MWLKKYLEEIQRIMDNIKVKGLSGAVILRWLAILTLIAMVVTGFGQMPIFKRYYIADIPGLGWTADYYITHNIHYVGAVILLALSAYFAAAFFLYHRKTVRITRPGLVMFITLAVLFISGILKVISSQKGVYFGALTLINLDLVHTIFTFLFLILAGIFKILKYRWYEKGAE